MIRTAPRQAGQLPAQNVVVTGGAGYIGSSLVGQLVRDGHQVCVIDDLSSGTRARLATAHPAAQLPPARCAWSPGRFSTPPWSGTHAGTRARCSTSPPRSASGASSPTRSRRCGPTCSAPRTCCVPARITAARWSSHPRPRYTGSCPGRPCPRPATGCWGRRPCRAGRTPRPRRWMSTWRSPTRPRACGSRSSATSTATGRAWTVRATPPLSPSSCATPWPASPSRSMGTAARRGASPTSPTPCAGPCWRRRCRRPRGRCSTSAR